MTDNNTDTNINISLDTVISAIDNKIITFKKCEDSFDNTVCFIGDYWFYCGIKDNKNDKDYTTTELAQFVLNAITNPEENGLGDAEAEYYKYTILEKLEKDENTL